MASLIKFPRVTELLRAGIQMLRWAEGKLLYPGQSSIPPMPRSPYVQGPAAGESLAWPRKAEPTKGLFKEGGRAKEGIDVGWREMAGLSLSPMEDLEGRAWRVRQNRAFGTDRAGPAWLCGCPAVTTDTLPKLFKLLLPHA